MKDYTFTNKIFGISEFVFKICFLAYGLATFNSFFAHTKIISALLFLTTASAGITLIYRLINIRYFIHSKMFWLSLAFMVSYIISFFINIRYANINGIKTLAFMGMEFFLLLATDERKKFDKYKSEIKIILGIFFFYMMAAVIVSIILMFCGYSNIAVRNGQTILSGFVWGRLWGVFTDPNYASVLSDMAIIISLYAIKKYKKPIWRAICIINIILQTLYIAFSDSRTGLVVAFAALAIYSYLRLTEVNLHIRKFLKNLLCICSAIFIGVFGVLTVKSVNKVYNTVISSIAENEPDEQSEETFEKYKVGREKDIEQDISNRRFDLWLSALETVKLKPIFGVSFESVVSFAKENLPKTYLINNDHGIFNNYHNLLFNVLVGQGIIGLIILLIMIIYAGIHLIKTVYRSVGTEDYSLCSMIFTLLVVALASAMFVSEIIYAISANMMLFWYLLGIMLKKSGECSNNDENQCNSPGI